MDQLSSKKPLLFQLSHKSCATTATTVLVLILLPLCTGHLGSLAHNGEGKPPLLSHVRVSRGPMDEYGLLPKSKGILSSGRMNLIKSPSYQHKMLHMSQFHSPSVYQNPIYHPHLSPSNIDFNDNGLSSTSMYPVASVHLRNGGSGHGGRKIGFNSDDLQPDGPDYVFPAGGEQEQDDADQPSFTPFIGARALSNIPKFFQHIRENLDALHLSEQELNEDEEDLLPQSKEYIEEQKDLPARRGDYFMSDGRLSVNTDGLGYAYDNDNSRPGPEVPKLRPNHRKEEEAVTELDYFMGRDPKYKKANQYNPSWLFTNLGLGKRSHL